jgi:hypothetical protein
VVLSDVAAVPEPRCDGAVLLLMVETLDAATDHFGQARASRMAGETFRES